MVFASEEAEPELLSRVGKSTGRFALFIAERAPSSLVSDGDSGRGVKTLKAGDGTIQRH
jgi:hypothetical protein